MAKYTETLRTRITLETRDELQLVADAMNEKVSYIARRALNLGLAALREREQLRYRDDVYNTPDVGEADDA